MQGLLPAGNSGRNIRWAAPFWTNGEGNETITNFIWAQHGSAELFAVNRLGAWGAPVV